MAAHGSDIPNFTALAAADLTGKQYHAMRLSAANTVNLASNVTAITVVGVLQNDPNTNQAARVAYLGESKFVAGAAVTAGVLVTHNSSGRCIAATSGSPMMGRAMEAAGADGDIIRVLLAGPPTAIGQL